MDCWSWGTRGSEPEGFSRWRSEKGMLEPMKAVQSFVRTVTMCVAKREAGRVGGRADHCR